MSNHTEYNMILQTLSLFCKEIEFSMCLERASVRLDDLHIVCQFQCFINTNQLVSLSIN